jgi:hypothetical protein
MSCNHCIHSVLVALGLTVALSISTEAVAQQRGSAAACRAAGPLIRISELPEASGLAVSRRVPGRLWSHNDSGQPELLALAANGSVTGRIRLNGATVEDWEAIAVGSCPAGSCLYVADIGDNGAQRKRITVYRVPEPAGANDAVTVSDIFHATYPDGPQDAESLFVTADGRLHVVTKGDAGPVALYRFPSALRPGASVQLERVGAPPVAGKPNPGDRITDSAVSPDGQWVVLRSNRALAFYRTQNLIAGNWREPMRVDLKELGEPQGEGVALGADNTVYVAGEGGGKGQPGTFARFTCAMPAGVY